MTADFEIQSEKSCAYILSEYHILCAKKCGNVGIVAIQRDGTESSVKLQILKRYRIENSIMVE